MEKGINVHILNTTFEYESRILKETKTISELGLFDVVMMFGVMKKGLPKFEIIDDKRSIYRIQVFTKFIPGLLGKMVSQIEWQFKLFIKLLFLKHIQVINAHALPVLSLAVLLKKIKKIILIYDAHELETETLNSTGIRKIVARWIERKLIKSVDHLIVVSNSIADWYRRTYQLEDVYVVRNIPLLQELSDLYPINLKGMFNLGSQEILFIYQGTISVGRGIDEILNLFSQVKNDKHIVFIGEGGNVEKIKLYQQRFPNIHYLPAVPGDKLLQYTMGADVGIHLIDPSCLNHIYCLPNKIFEYLNAGIALLVRDLPEMAAIVKAHNCGWVAPKNFDEIKRLIEQVTFAEIELKRENAKSCRGCYSWQAEAKSLIKLYSNISY